MGRTYSKPTIPVKARHRESMELDWSAEEAPTRPKSQVRQKIRPRLISVTEEVAVSANDPRRED